MKETQDAGGAGEEIYPIHTMDDSKVNHCFVSWTMRFNDVLDPAKLNGALCTLLEIGDWKKLGGRLRFKVSLVMRQCISSWMQN